MERGVAVATLWQVLRSRQDRRAKIGARLAEQRRSTVNAARERWFEGQLDLDPTRIVFIDETAANTKMARLAIVAPRGERCRAAGAPWPFEHHHLHCRAALRRHRCAHGPRRPDERRWPFSPVIEQALVPELRSLADIVIMDNLPAHKVHGVRRSRPPARACDTCPRLVPTSIPSGNGLRQAQGPLHAAAARTILDLMASHRWDTPCAGHPHRGAAFYPLAAADTMQPERKMPLELFRGFTIVASPALRVRHCCTWFLGFVLDVRACTVKLALVFIKHFVKVRFISIIFYRVFSNVDAI